MQFTKRFWSGLEDGSITAAVRKWKRPSIKVGGTMLSPGGLLAIDSIEVVELWELTEDDARHAGYGSLDDLVEELESRDEGVIHRIRFHRIGDDPRVALRNRDDLEYDEIEAISRRLARLDRASGHGPWTRATLDLIDRYPGRRAPDLAGMVERDTQPFKIDVRKLKAIGLTESLRVGYRLSPRGTAFRRAVGWDV